MRILAFDSTAKIASVAVLDGDKITGACSIDNGLTQSELLLPMAEDLLRSLGLTHKDIDAYAVAVGPGSFTGVRIGVSLVKGLAFGRDIPCIEVSTLEALARNLAPLEGVIVPCMDARRAQVYSATFISDGETLTRVSEDRAIALSDLAEELRAYDDKKIYLCADGYDIAYAALTNVGIKLSKTPELLIGASAASVARVAKDRYENGEYTSDRELAPTYLRLPQAERERLERMQNTNA